MHRRQRPTAGSVVDRERLADDRFFDLAAAEQADRDAAADDLAVLDDANLLQVLLEAALGDAGRLATVAAQVLGLAAILDRVAERRLVLAVGGESSWPA